MSMRMMTAICHGAQNQGVMKLACKWAKQFDGKITGLGVVDMTVVAPTPAMALPGGNAPLVPPDTALMSDATERIQSTLRDYADQCMQAEVEYEQVKSLVTSHEEILSEAQSQDVVLLGSPLPSEAAAPGGPAKTMLENVLRHSPRPVVVVPDKIADGQGVLVAYDGSLQASRSLQALVASGLIALGKVTILNVGEEFEETNNTPVKRAVDYLAAHGIEAEIHHVVDRAAEHAIVDEAAHRNVELIVMGAYGQSRLAEFFVGSTTSKVIDQSTVPMFLYH